MGEREREEQQRAAIEGGEERGRRGGRGGEERGRRGREGGEDATDSYGTTRTISTNRTNIACERKKEGKMEEVWFEKRGRRKEGQNNASEGE